MTVTSPSLETIAELVEQEPGLIANIYPVEIQGGADAARLMNEVMTIAMAATGVNGDNLLTPADLVAISEHIRSKPALYDRFVEGHGDDEGNEETGFHLVQGDGGAYQFQGRDFIDTVADAIYHIGFEIENGRFLNEDGNANEEVADVAGWLNYFVNGRNVLFGSAGDDRLNSGHYSFDLADAAHERVLAGAGNDSISAGTGRDTVLAGDGDDRAGGGKGRDLLRGQEGNDRLYGEDGNDTLEGGNGFDSMAGGIGRDRMLGQSGNDHLWGEDGRDTLKGGLGEDHLGGGAGADRLFGDAGDDTIGGDEGADMLNGGQGNDKLYGEEGNDRIFGADGNDTIGGDEGNDQIFGNDGDDSVWAGDGNDLVEGQAGHDHLGGNDGADTMRGGNGDDSLYGGDGADRLFGGFGGDSLKGDAGNDLVIGGGGADFLLGGTGRDTLNGGQGADRLVDWEGADEEVTDIFVFTPGSTGLTEGNWDVIEGFTSGIDKIDLTAFGGLTYRHKDPFSASGSGELRHDGDVVWVDGDGDGVADAAIEVKWLNDLVTADFIL